eukprot:scaffold21.g2195.t1
MSSDRSELLPSRLLHISRAYFEARALQTAVKLRLFTLLDGQDGSTWQEVAERAGLVTDPEFRGVRDLLDLLVSIRVLEREGERCALCRATRAPGTRADAPRSYMLRPERPGDGGGAVYRNGPEAAAFLVEGRAHWAGGLLLHDHDRNFRLWACLEEALRRGEVSAASREVLGLLHIKDVFASEPQAALAFAHGMKSHKLALFALLARRFDFARYATLADVGGSLGVLSVEACLAHPHLRARTCDLPVLRRPAQEYVVDLDCFAEGISWPASDAHEALRPGGALLVVEQFLDDERREATRGMGLSLLMLLDELEGWAADAGFVRTERIPLHPGWAAVAAYKEPATASCGWLQQQQQLRPMSAAALPEADDAQGHSVDLAEFRDTVRTFARTHVAPHAAEIDRLNGYPPGFEFWRAAGEWGLHGITAPAEYGGLGLGYLHHCIAMEELSRASGSVALSYGAHSNLCISQLVRNASEAQKRKYLPPLISGAHVGALAMSEVSAGSDVIAMRTRAERRDGHFVLNGNKMWITNGPIADTLVVYAKTTPEAGAHGITAFIIEKGMKGFSTAQKLDKLGMRGSDTCELIFEDCEVPTENVLGEVDKACLDLCLPYVRERSQFGKKIGEFQAREARAAVAAALIQAKLADMYAATSATRAFVAATARAADAGAASRVDCAAVILYAAEAATRLALDAIQILGGNGYVNEFPAGRLLRDAKLYEIGAGTSEIRRTLIGRELFRRDD